MRPPVQYVCSETWFNGKGDCGISGKKHLCTLWLGHDGAHVCGHDVPMEQDRRILAHIASGGAFPRPYADLYATNALRRDERERVARARGLFS